MLRAGIVALTGTLLAIPIAVALSPLFPTGLARAADPSPGLHLDIVAVGGGALVALVVLMLLVVVPAARAARLAERDDVFGRAQTGAERASSSVEAVTRAGASAPAVVGIRLALEPGRGRTAVPVRTTIAGVVLAVAALTITLTFGASLHYLLDTPRLYGLTWDAGVSGDNVTLQEYTGAIKAALRAGILRQGASLRDYAQPDGRRGRMQESFKVYGRAEEPCERCGTLIAKTRVAGRGTWFCPRCQPHYATRRSSSRPSRSRRQSSV